MKLHTSLTGHGVRAALERAKSERLISVTVSITVWAASGSRTHPHGYEIQLGSYDKHSLPAEYKDQHGKTMHVRRYRNSTHGDAEYAATWHEWGWFILEIFTADPGTRWSGPGYYDNLADFHRRTKGAFADPGVREQYAEQRHAREDARCGERYRRNEQQARAQEPTAAQSSAVLAEAERKRAAIEAEFAGTWTNTLHP